ncbi:MAG: hypothetical protein HRU15_10765 [Planctomycetes bacterium]|nr:hypothetical protein [Planctomycetota bacterium]
MNNLKLFLIVVAGIAFISLLYLYFFAFSGSDLQAQPQIQTAPKKIRTAQFIPPLSSAQNTQWDYRQPLLFIEKNWSKDFALAYAHAGTALDSNTTINSTEKKVSPAVQKLIPAAQTALKTEQAIDVRHLNRTHDNLSELEAYVPKAHILSSKPNPAAIRQNKHSVNLEAASLIANFLFDPKEFDDQQVHLCNNSDTPYAIMFKGEKVSTLRVNGGLIVPGRYYLLIKLMHISSTENIEVIIRPADAVQTFYRETYFPPKSIN